MINKQFGTYLVLSKNEILSKEKGRVYWICECQKCKSIQNVRTDGLKRFPSVCPECKNNISGQKYGKLTVLYKTKTDINGHSYWMCECECGNQKEISSSNLKSGKIQSCGCLHSQIISTLNLKDLTGQKFGKLTVIKRSTNIGENRVKWLCKCECGNVIEVYSNNLINGHTISCGCIKSKGELKIRQLLNQLNISYKTEFIFSNLPNRRFDFYLPDLDICIEYDGKQHYQFVNTWHENEEVFQKSVQRDKEKTDFCKNNNIQLIRIPYYDYNNLNIEYLRNKINECCCYKNL